MASAMAWVLLWWTVGVLALTGIGAGVSRALRSSTDPLSAFWLGLCLTIIVVNGWHLVRPIDGWLTGLLLGAGALGWWRGAPLLMDGPLRLTVALVAACALPLSNLALEATPNGDSGVYHLAAIQWAGRGALTPGLGNLEPFLGYGHGFSQFAALLSVGPLEGRAHHVTNGLFAMAFLALGLHGALTLVGGRITAQAAAAASLLPWTVFVTLRRDLASGSSDLAEVAVGAALFVSWIEACTAPDVERPAMLERTALLATGLVVLKFSGAAVGAALVALVMIQLPWKRALAVGGLSFAGVLPVAIGMVVRTGYFPFPGALLEFPVDWKVPRVVADGITGMVLGYGRRRLSTLGADASGAWMGEVAVELLTWTQEFVVPVLLLGGGLLVAVTVRTSPRGRAWLVLVPPAVALVFWFFTSPYVVYAGVWLQALGAGGLALATMALLARRDVVMLRLAAFGLVLFSCWRSSALLEPGFLRFAWRAGFEEHVVDSRLERTASGLEVHVPVKPGAFCWNTPQPCTPTFDPWLRLRDPQQPERGFRWEPPPGLDAMPAAVPRYQLDRAAAKRVR